MSDMHEATAAGIRELKALLSAALMIAQARERKRERDLREQERELVAREVRRRDSGERGLHPQQDAQRHAGQDSWEVSPSNQAWRDTTEGREVTRRSTEANQAAWDRTGLGGTFPQHRPARAAGSGGVGRTAHPGAGCAGPTPAHRAGPAAHTGVHEERGHRRPRRALGERPGIEQGRPGAGG